VKERLQKILARAGLASRRGAEELILAGRVRVDGRVVKELGVQVDARSESVEIDGKRVNAEPFVYIAFHKPREVVSTLRDPEGRQTVKNFLSGIPVRVVPVGRLDYHTSGILLLTNDGEFAQVLGHPSSGGVKEYVAKVKGELTDEEVARFRESIDIDGRATRPADVRRLRIEDGKTWLGFRLHEGRNRQIRRLGDAAGFPIMRLARVSFAGITHEDLRPGHWRHLSVDELRTLKQLFGVPKRVRPAADLADYERRHGRHRPRIESKAEERAAKPRGKRLAHADGAHRPQGEFSLERPERGQGSPRADAARERTARAAGAARGSGVSRPAKSSPGKGFSASKGARRMDDARDVARPKRAAAARGAASPQKAGPARKGVSPHKAASPQKAGPPRKAASPVRAASPHKAGAPRKAARPLGRASKR
jgi:23S rRNA pseudouridine2605 synthase